MIRFPTQRDLKHSWRGKTDICNQRGKRQVCPDYTNCPTWTAAQGNWPGNSSARLLLWAVSLHPACLSSFRSHRSKSKRTALPYSHLPLTLLFLQRTELSQSGNKGKKIPSVLLCWWQAWVMDGWVERKGRRKFRNLRPRPSLPGCLPLTGKDRIVSSPSSLQETPVFFSTTAASLTPLTPESHLKAPPNPKSHQKSILVLSILSPLFSQQTGSAKIKRTIRKA